MTIQATQLLPNAPTPEGVNYGTPDPDGYVDGVQGKYLVGKYWVHTLEGPLVAQLGDWIITGIGGEVYPCKPDIFEKSYEPINVAETI